jgi:hypothetical protein
VNGSKTALKEQDCSGGKMELMRMLGVPMARLMSKNKVRKQAVHRRRGRPRESKNKIDIQTIASKAVKARGGQLSVAHMSEVLEHLRRMISITQPYNTEKNEQTGEIRVIVRPEGNYEQWEECIRMFIELVRKLAPYQSPRLASIKGENRPAEQSPTRWSR